MLLEVELTTADLQVAPIKHKHIEGFPAQDQHPLAKVKLAHRFLKLEQIGRLNVLLDYFLLRLLVRHYFGDRPRAVDPDPPRVIARLHDPKVVSPVDPIELRILFEQQAVELEDLKLIKCRYVELANPVLNQCLMKKKDLELLVVCWVLDRLGPACYVLKFLGFEVAFRE